MPRAARRSFCRLSAAPTADSGTELGNLIAPTLDMFRFADNVVEIKTVEQATKKGAIPGQMLSVIKPAGTGHRRRAHRRNRRDPGG